MDSSGKIKEFSSQEEAIKNGYTTELTRAEAEHLLSAIPQEERHGDLALLRYMAEHGHRKHGGVMKVALRHAFMAGFEEGLKHGHEGAD